MKKVVLCSCGQKCPVALIEDDKITIRDDFGGEVVLTKEQLEILNKNL